MRSVGEVGVWPHAVMTGHAHSYQRFTRHRSDGTEIPYIICGNGGHNVQKLKSVNGIPLRVPQILQSKTANDDQVTFESYDDTNYVYLRLIVDSKQLLIEYHLASDGIQAKTPDDSVTIDLATRKRTTYSANDLGLPARTERTRQLYSKKSESAISAKKRH